MKPVTFDELGEPDSVAEQLLRTSLTTQRDEVLVKLIECPPDFHQLLAVQAEAKVINRLVKDAKSQILRYNRKGSER